MKKFVIAVWLAVVSSFLLVGISPAADLDFSHANYGSVIVRDGALPGTDYFGHAAVVVWPPFGNSPNTTEFIAQANGIGLLSSLTLYSGFLGGSNNYLGHFRTWDTQWNSHAFRANVVMFANQAMGKSYTFINLGHRVLVWVKTGPEVGSRPAISGVECS